MSDEIEDRNKRKLEEGLAALRRALPTSRHADLLFEAVEVSLGERAFVEDRSKGQCRKLFRRDQEHHDLLIPWPVLTRRNGERIILDIFHDHEQVVPENTTITSLRVASLA